MELEMVEITEHNIYRVKNFAKNQNIKAKLKNKTEDKEVNISKPVVQENEKLKDEIDDNKINEHQNQISENEVESIVDSDGDEFENNNIEISNTDIEIDNKNTNRNSQDNIPILLETKKRKKKVKKKKEDNSIEFIDEEIDDNSIFCITEGEIFLGEGDQIMDKWSFVV